MQCISLFLKGHMDFVLSGAFYSVIGKEVPPPIIHPTFRTLFVTSESHNQFSNNISFQLEPL